MGMEINRENKGVISRRISMNRAMLIRFGLILISIIALASIIWGSFSKVNKTKAEVAHLNEEKGKLYEAAVAHHKWGENLIENISMGTEFTGSLDPTTCGFGSFIYSNEVQNEAEFRDFLTQVEPIHNALHEAGKKIVALPESSISEKEKIYMDEVKPAINQLVGLINSQISVMDNQINTHEKSLNQVIDAALLICIVAVAVIAVLSIDTLFYIRRQIVNPIRRLKSESEKLSEGDLSGDYFIPTKIEEIYQLSSTLGKSTMDLKRMIEEIQTDVGQLADKNFTVRPSITFPGEFAAIEGSLGRLTDAIVGTMEEIKLSSEQVTAGSESMAAGAQDLASGAASQANSVEKLSATVGLIEASASENAENVRYVNGLGDVAKAVVSNSLNQMGQLTQSIADIQQSSTEISKITKTVDALAFQSNILALNAAVEAARAGQAGKGFAVVAHEVRSLSQQSAESAKYIASLVHNSLDAVQKGVELTDSTNKALREVEENAKQVFMTVGKIAESTEKQFKSIEEVAHGIYQISAVVQTNAATSQESAAVSEELNGQAVSMKHLIDQFRLH